MRLNLPGLVKEQSRGKHRWRVRKEGNPRIKTTLTVTPDHPAFMEYYRAARAGIRLTPEIAPEDAAVRGSIAWLTHKYESHLRGMVEDGRASPLTLRQRTGFLIQLRNDYGDYSLDIPTSEIRRMRDERGSTPGAADNFVKTIRAVYAWAMDVGIADQNPAAGIARINRGGGGATPWSVDDLRRYTAIHRPGTQAHLALSLFVFTACRIGDAIMLGRGHEVQDGPVTWLEWQPGKRGSAKVSIPMMPPLFAATRAGKVIGPTYLLTDYGRPFASTEGLRNRFRKWCDAAGLEGRSAHGVRKAAATLMAEQGATQHQIMAILGHTQARTSEIYTRSAARRKMAVEGMALLGSLEW